MTKFLTLLISLALCFSMTACHHHTTGRNRDNIRPVYHRPDHKPDYRPQHSHHHYNGNYGHRRH